MTLLKTPVAPARERILAAATTLFYEQGLRAVSADRIIAEVGITKVTFYRHFSSKEDLIVAYLDRQAETERERFGAVRAQVGAPEEVLRVIAETIGEHSCLPEFRGCAFINAGAEYPDPASPVRQRVSAHREWFLGWLEELLSEWGIEQPAIAARQLMLLRDGAMVSGYLGDPSAIAENLIAAGSAVLRSARTPLAAIGG